jgi:hypothetical protein
MAISFHSPMVSRPLTHLFLVLRLMVAVPGPLLGATVVATLTSRSSLTRLAPLCT